MGAGDAIPTATWQDVLRCTTDKAIVRLVAQSAQSLTDNTATAIQFGSGSEEIDTHSWHDTATNNTRVTPNRAGLIEVRGTVMFGSRDDYSDVDAWIRFNGSTNKAPAWRSPYATDSGNTLAAGVISASTVCFVEVNGTTDYVELMGIQNNVAGSSVSLNQSSQYSSVLEVMYVRPAL